MKRRYIGQWLISWCWIAVVEDHGDGTCTILEYDRTKTPVEFEKGRLGEDENRKVWSVKVGDENLRVKNPRHVFSYKPEKSMISR